MKAKMEIAHERISECLIHKKDELNLSDIKLIEFKFEIPDIVRNLNCSLNKLKSLPDVLPSTLTELDCSHCQINFLPENLPAGLVNLLCYNNPLIRLPINLPKNLKRIDCCKTKLTQMSNLPASVEYLCALYTPYLYVDEELSTRFGFHRTENYSMIMNRLKKIRKAVNRKNKIAFCSELQDAIDEFRYRPGKDGYQEVASRNAGKFVDL